MPDENSNSESGSQNALSRDFSPAAFMRARHPELFSDSERRTKPLLSRDLLEYQLDTLTNRKQEIEFEYFCRRLAEKEICPNLRPQTGPTGGGDSKADAETIPVAADISRLWIGTSSGADNERWAFAFSAKKEWQSKVRSDVGGIARTARNYKRIYYITNQFAPDKNRAKLEDELSRKHGIPVCILDRNWIVKAVLEDGHVDIAIQSLGLSGLAQEGEDKIGPRDLKRQEDLDRLEQEINDATRYEGAQYQLAEDCLRAALLARGLEKPRIEIEGLFGRAERIADQVGHRQQQQRIFYNHAWTAFWWYHDIGELNRLYDLVGERALDAMQADDVERLLNLWQLLQAIVGKGEMSTEDAKLAGRTARLKQELDRLASDKNRPNNALQARTNRLVISLNEAFQAQSIERLEDVWAGFRDVVKQAEHLVDYPFERFVKLVQELGDLVPDSDAFDEVFEGAVRLIESRRGAGEGGIALLNRAFQKLEAEKPYDAIRLLGRAQERLFKREYRGELISALTASSFAYGHVELLWAARNSALAAVERCFAFYNEDGAIVRPVVPCLEKLIWTELQLGRIPQMLGAIELRSAALPHLKLESDALKRLEDDWQIQDALLGRGFF